jgi:hypothetical protein
MLLIRDTEQDVTVLRTKDIGLGSSGLQIKHTKERRKNTTGRGGLRNSSFLLIHSLVFSLREAGLTGTRAQSRDRYGSGTLHPGQVLGVVSHCFPLSLDVPTFVARCLSVRNDARDPSSERYNCGREIVR